MNEMPVLTTYEWTDNMPYVYLDVLNQVSPITGNSTCAYNNGAEHSFAIFGSCDYLYYGGTFDTIAGVKVVHESRHKLCWKYERQPMFLYCHTDDVDSMTDVFSNAEKPECPLVLSLLQIEKVGIKNDQIDLNNLLTVFRKKLCELLGSSNKGIALWNLGGSDIVLGLRVDKLEAAANVILSLQLDGLQLNEHKDERLFVYSTSSHCAIALSAENGSISKEALQSWLETDRQVRFHMLFETSFGHNGLLTQVQDAHMVLGERDYEVSFPDVRSDWPEFLYTQLIESVKVGNVFHHRTTYVVPEIKLNSMSKPLYPDNAELLKWDSNDDTLFEELDAIAETIAQVDFADENACANNAEQISHCCNSLLGLIKYAFRLQATMGQYDLFCYIRRVYCSLAKLMHGYTSELRTILSKASQDHKQKEVLWHRISEMTHDLFITLLMQ